MRLKNAIARTFFNTARSAQTQSGPSPDQRFVGNRAHGRSECEEARSSPLPFRAIVENPPRSRSGRLKRPLAPQPALCGGFLRALNKIPKRRLEIFHAIGRKGAVQGQSRQPLMSWRAKDKRIKQSKRGKKSKNQIPLCYPLSHPTPK